MNLPENKDVFLICTYGGKPVFDSIKKIVKEKQGRIVGEFSCKGFDTFGPFKLIGGISKGHPDKNDLDNAKAFFKELEKGKWFKSIIMYIVYTYAQKNRDSSHGVSAKVCIRIL